MEGHKCNAFGEKLVAAQQLFGPFFEGNVKTYQGVKSGPLKRYIHAF